MAPLSYASAGSTIAGSDPGEMRQATSEESAEAAVDLGEGLGDWRIHVITRTIKDLRDRDLRRPFFATPVVNRECTCDSICTTMPFVRGSYEYRNWRSARSVDEQQMFSWTQFTADLVIVIVGSGIAIWGALIIADRTFKRDVQQDREDRKLEDEKRREEERERLENLSREEHAAAMRSIEAVLAEIKLNMRSIDFMREHSASPFPLRLDAYTLFLPQLVNLPDTLAESIQGAVMMVDRYNSTGEWTPVARLQTAQEARQALNEAGHRIADYLQSSRAEPNAPLQFWRLNYRDGLDPRPLQEQEDQAD
jgi:hypothetical protein